MILIAQDLSYYGLDLYRKQLLPELISELLKIESLNGYGFIISILQTFPMALIPLIRDNPRICKYIDIPIQHITDNMLGNNETVTRQVETEAVLNKIRNEIPEAVIRTTLIAGHPGETEQDYRTQGIYHFFQI